MVLKGLLEKGENIELVTSKGGVLDELNSHPNMKRYSYSYRFSTNPALTMLRYSWVQLYTFFYAFRYIFRKNTVFYINTLLPVGPALAGRLMGKRVVYHYHENAFAKGVFYKALAFCMQKLAHEIICVSAYQASFLKRKKGVTVIPNALPTEFVSRLHPDAEAAFNRKTVLMLSSLKEYKGTREFIELADRLPQYKFVLVINDTQENIDKYLSDNKITNIKGLTIYPRQPVIVPTEGGIAEMVENGVNGFKMDVQELDEIEETIRRMLTNSDLYLSLSVEALSHSAAFNEQAMLQRIEDVVYGNK